MGIIRDGKVLYLKGYGIADILSGENVAQNPAYNADLGFSKRYLILNIISVVIILLLIWHVKRTKDFIKRIRKSKSVLVRNILVSIVTDVFVPLTILVYYLSSMLTGSDFELNIISIRYYLVLILTGFNTDYTYIGIVAILLLLICGITKAVLFINKNIIHRRN